MLANLLVKLMVEEFWKNGIDVIKSFYNKYNCYGILLMTTVDNVQQLRDLINSWELNELLKGKYSVDVKNILNSIPNP